MKYDAGANITTGPVFSQTLKVMTSEQLQQP